VPHQSTCNGSRQIRWRRIRADLWCRYPGNRGRDERVSNCSAADDRTGRGKGVARLVTTAKNRIDQASLSNRGYEARNASARGAAEIPDRRRVARIRVAGRVGNFRSVNRADRTNRRRLVGRHFGAEEVRDCDGRDDQNDRHDDQKLD
jgi:hypothetical protein